MGARLGNNQRIGIDGLTSSSPIRFIGTDQQFTVCVLFRKYTTGSNQFGRLVSVASGGNGANGYEACYNYSGVNDNRLLGLMNGSGANVLVDVADAYTDGDYVAAFFQYDRNGNEIIYADYNDGNGLNLLKSAAVYNGSGGTGTVSFMIGGAGWSTGRDCTADIYRVLIYGRHLGVPQMEWMVFSNFANRPPEDLTVEYNCKPHDQFAGDTITNDIPDLGTSGITLDQRDGSPTVIEGITFEV